MNPIPKLTELGQSLWYDNIQRKLLEKSPNGEKSEFATMIERGDIRGVTSNPSIFQNAIANSNDYDSALMPLAWAGWDPESIFWQLAVEDIQMACDLFRPLYDETKSGDGYVSIEVSPNLAHETEKTIKQAKSLWERVDRPNLMVKIPATLEGIPAIKKSIADGININITLIFSLTRYAAVMEAYLSGLEDRVKGGQPIDRIASVASFFVSRVDSKVDGYLPEDSSLRGQAAIANARLAYEAFEKTFAGGRWDALDSKQAQLQRPLWASTSTKNPAYPDTTYIDSLIGKHTVNTVPPKTLDAFRDHGTALETIFQDLEAAHELFAKLDQQGVSMDLVTQELEDEGVKSFATAFTGLLETIDDRRSAAASQLGPLAASVSKRITKLEDDSIATRLWEGDPSLWTTDPDAQAEVKKRLGWLRLPDTSRPLLPEFTEFAQQVHKDGLQRVLLIGMGGSSLAPEVLSLAYEGPDQESADGAACLSILDSTDPAQIRSAVENFPPDKSLYVVSSKSGATAEVLSLFEYFWELSGADGSHFVAITDPGTPLEKLAQERGFRKIFHADPNVGGRYSALTAFGLLPAALIGLDLERLLARAGWMMKQSTPDVVPARNPGLVLGAVLAEAALAGRDKLTILADGPLSSFGSWMEQLIAESSGKDGVGIIPVDREPIGSASVYGNDRLFIYLRQSGEHDEGVETLRAAGHPVLELSVPTPYDIGAEFYRWEIATAIACHILGVNAFDQPDVEDAKLRANAKIAEYQEKGALTNSDFVALNDAKPELEKLLKGTVDGDYVAITAFLPRNEDTLNSLQDLRVAIRKKTKSAVTLGFGPRFLHSTGQLHKGGPNTGIFLQITADPVDDFEIPSQSMSFGTLQLAQALGDYEALVARGRRVLRIHLPSPAEVHKLKEMLVLVIFK